MKMPHLSFAKLHFLLLALFALSLRPSLAIQPNENFLQCLTLHSPSISSVVYAPYNSSYTSILNFTAHNLRFIEPQLRRPQFIITPTEISHIQASIICSKQYQLQIRTRSGGHDFEGISYESYAPWILVDMIRLNSIDIDVANEVAWVQVGATLGQLYYAISQASGTLGFPAGISPNVGVGGHISGGGYGILQRKYGLAADNTLDAIIVDVNEKILNRTSMGEDLFWAIRGASGASFGIIISFKVRLVPVPPIMTICTPIRTLAQNADNLMYDWQFITHTLPNEVSSYLILNRANMSDVTNKTVQAAFQFHFLGRANELLALFNDRFPQLGLAEEDCEEMSWIQAVVVMGGLPSGTSPTQLLNRTLAVGMLRPYQYFAKMKSDFVTEPIPKVAIKGIWDSLAEPEAIIADVYFVAHGGRMAEILESETPYPHRAGILYMSAYLVFWENGSTTVDPRHISWNRRLYRFMAPYVSKNPRQAYMNYRDIDVGTNSRSGPTSFAQASVWGFKYFKNNFYRLAHIKAKVDPTNFFQNEQSVPPTSDLILKIDETHPSI